MGNYQSSSQVQVQVRVKFKFKSSSSQVQVKFMSSSCQVHVKFKSSSSQVQVQVQRGSTLVIACCICYPCFTVLPLLNMPYYYKYKYLQKCLLEFVICMKYNDQNQYSPVRYCTSNFCMMTVLMAYRCIQKKGEIKMGYMVMVVGCVGGWTPVSQPHYVLVFCGIFCWFLKVFLFCIYLSDFIKSLSIVKRYI